MRARWLVLLAAVFASQPALAAFATTWEADFDDDTKSWKEIAVQIPRYPLEKDLVLLDMGVASRHRFYVDSPSLSVGEDGVVRYTVVLKTAGGARNVTFEGIRCDTREHKIYALGHSDGSWVRARAPRWQRITRDQPYQFTLHREYFCSSQTRPTPPKQALDALRYGGASSGKPID